jgi:hypothetical protein
VHNLGGKHSHALASALDLASIDDLLLLHSAGDLLADDASQLGHLRLFILLRGLFHFFLFGVGGAVIVDCDLFAELGVDVLLQLQAG